MEPYRHILLATDLSDDADAASVRAVDIAQRYDANLTLLHVVDYSIDDLAVEWLEPPDIPAAEFLRTRAHQALLELARALGREHAQTAVVMDVKSPVREILRYSQDHAVDLLVIGAHGRHGLATWLNSASTNVLHHAGCDVLAIRIGE